MTNLTKANQQRLDNQLNKLVNYQGKAMTMRDVLIGKQLPMVCEISDSMIKWSRTKFNRMGCNEQREYEAKLREKKLYWVNDIEVSKMVYDWAVSYKGDI